MIEVATVVAAAAVATAAAAAAVAMLEAVESADLEHISSQDYMRQGEHNFDKDRSWVPVGHNKVTLLALEFAGTVPGGFVSFVEQCRKQNCSLQGVHLDDETAPGRLPLVRNSNVVGSPSEVAA